MSEKKKNKKNKNKGLQISDLLKEMDLGEEKEYDAEAEEDSSLETVLTKREPVLKVEEDSGQPAESPASKYVYRADKDPDLALREDDKENFISMSDILGQDDETLKEDLKPEDVENESEEFDLEPAHEGQNDLKDEKDEGEAVLKIAGLSKKIGKKLVLDNINLQVAEGQILGLLGENGSGKTSLLRIIAGLAHPDKGQLTVDNIQVGRLTKTMVSFLPDIAFLSNDSSMESAASYFRKFFPDFDQTLFADLANKLAIPSKMKFSAMSKGFRDRLQLALVMSRRARLFLLDEPLGGVDPIVRDEILNILEERIRQGSTMIISSHQIHDMERLFSHAAFIKEGRIIGLRPVDDFRSGGKSLDEAYKELFKEN